MSPENVDVSGCAFDRGRENAVCVRQTSTSAPRLAVLRSDGALHDGYDPNHDVRDRAIQTPVASTWTNAKGQTATGYRLVPDGCGGGRRCPVIVITHGYDAMNKFMWQGHEWDYPSQVFAAKGYVVLLVNEPRAPGGVTPPDAVSTMESAVRDAVDRGEADPNRVGIAGYSRGAQISQRALAISTVFKAGSSGDGGDGGPEVGERINAPLLAQTTEAVGVLLVPVVKRLRARGVPAEMVLFPNETHSFHQPRHREAAMRQNLDSTASRPSTRSTTAAPTTLSNALWSRLKLSEGEHPRTITATTRSPCRDEPSAESTRACSPGSPHSRQSEHRS